MSDGENTEVNLINKEIFEKALENYAVVHLMVMYHEMVVLPEIVKSPEWYDRKQAIHLEYGLNMPVPITGLRIVPIGVEATLSFQRVPFHTFVPWKAVVAMSLDGPIEAKPEPDPPVVKKKSFLKLVP